MNWVRVVGTVWVIMGLALLANILIFGLEDPSPLWMLIRDGIISVVILVIGLVAALHPQSVTNYSIGAT